MTHYINKISLSFIAVLILLPTLFACTKTPINGNLDGEWEVMEVYPEPPKAEEEVRLFYNFSRNVCQLTVYGGSFTLGNMTYDGETLWLNFPFISTPLQETQLKRYGILTNPVTFNVEFDGKNRMILSNEDSVIILRKF